MKNVADGAAILLFRFDIVNLSGFQMAGEFPAAANWETFQWDLNDL